MAIKKKLKAPAKIIDKLGLYSNASVLKNTGRDWVQWIEILNTVGGLHLSHKDIVAFLKKKYKLRPWWQQSVTNGYEIHIGRRVEGRNEKGEYSMTTTKAFSVSQKVLWQLVTSPEGQMRWLNPLSPLEFKPKNSFEVRGGIFGALRTMKAPERIRMSWQDNDWAKPSILTLQIVQPMDEKSGKRKPNKSMLIINHGELKDARLKEKMREHWKLALQELLAYVIEKTSQ